MREAYVTKTEEETRAVGAELASTLKAGDVYYLHGDLGAGKTAFVKGLVGALSKDALVKSPTFSLMNEYAVEGTVHRIVHLDLYRLNDPSELEAIDFHPYLKDSALFIEWPEKGEGYLPSATAHLIFEHGQEGGRAISWG